MDRPSGSVRPEQPTPPINIRSQQNEILDLNQFGSRGFINRVLQDNRTALPRHDRPNQTPAGIELLTTEADLL